MERFQPLDVDFGRMSLKPVQDQIVEALIVPGESGGKNKQSFGIEHRVRFRGGNMPGDSQCGPLLPEQILNGLEDLFFIFLRGHRATPVE